MPRGQPRSWAAAHPLSLLTSLVPRTIHRPGPWRHRRPGPGPIHRPQCSGSSEGRSEHQHDDPGHGQDERAPRRDLPTAGDQRITTMGTLGPARPRSTVGTGDLHRPGLRPPVYRPAPSVAATIQHRGGRFGRETHRPDGPARHPSGRYATLSSSVGAGRSSAIGPPAQQVFPEYSAESSHPHLPVPITTVQKCSRGPGGDGSFPPRGALFMRAAAANAPWRVRPGPGPIHRPRCPPVNRGNMHEETLMQIAVGAQSR